MLAKKAGHSQPIGLKPLFLKTRFLPDESISSWLIRASLKQGCSTTTFTYYYWQQYRLWTYDVDKGFNHIDSQIHADMAVLAQASKEDFDKQTLTHFAEITNTLPNAQNINSQWVLPLSKRNRNSLLGYHYCPLCMSDDQTAHLKLNWRFSWYVYCLIHFVPMEFRCPSCGMPYQPNLIKPELRFINRCHACQNKLRDGYLKNLLLVSNAYLLQKAALDVLESGTATVFGNEVTVAEWFELMLFYINIARKAAKTKDVNYMFYRLYVALGFNTENMAANYPDLEESKTGLAFDYLPLQERITYMHYAYVLMEAPLEKWLLACKEIKATQNSFYLYNRKTTIPSAFLPVYDSLPAKDRVVRKKTVTEVKPASKKSVMRAWERLKRKMETRMEYEQNITKP